MARQMVNHCLEANLRYLAYLVVAADNADAAMPRRSVQVQLKRNLTVKNLGDGFPASSCGNTPPVITRRRHAPCDPGQSPVIPLPLGRGVRRGWGGTARALEPSADSWAVERGRGEYCFWSILIPGITFDHF